MNKKVLILSASPRVGGNSDLLCDELAKGVIDAGNTIEKLHIQKLKINYCLGCEVCMNNAGVCVQKDDMAMVIEKMKEADTVVFATPVYFYNMNAQLKVVIDRSFCQYQTLGFKKAAFLATSEDGSENAADTAIAGYHGYLRCLNGVTDAGVIAATGVYKKGDVKSKEYMKQAYELGKSL